MGGPSRKLIALNRFLISAYSNWASISKELNLPTRRWFVVMDQVTLVWSFVIILTSFFKFMQVPDRSKSSQKLPLEFNVTTNEQNVSLRDLLALNYLPNIDEFGKLYYGLVLVTVGSALAWRLYLRFRSEPPDGCKHQPFCSSSRRHIFDAKRELIEFLLSGPSEAASASECELGQTGEPVLESDEPEQAQDQVYCVPIRSADFLYDKSAARWKALALHLHLFSVFVFLLSAPLFYYIILGLNAVRSQFRSSQTSISNTLLEWYGPLEQTYACLQASLFFLATNLFLSLFHADLRYKCGPIAAEIRALSRQYQLERLNCVAAAEVRRQQLRIWAYFDNVLALDRFVSKYSAVTMATMVIGMSFGQSYLKVEDNALKCGTASALVSNFLSFTYLHLVSWHIERSSTPVQKCILSILARETSHEAKREWQRTLFGFFARDWPRTFTLSGRYAINLQSFSKAIFALATMSLVITRLFHKRTWEASFAHIQREAGAREAALAGLVLV